jgi:hypothetical protein
MIRSKFRTCLRFDPDKRISQSLQTRHLSTRQSAATPSLLIRSSVALRKSSVPKVYNDLGLTTVSFMGHLPLVSHAFQRLLLRN